MSSGYFFPLKTSPNLLSLLTIGINETFDRIRRNETDSDDGFCLKCHGRGFFQDKDTRFCICLTADHEPLELIRRYSIESLLGTGEFSSTFRAEDRIMGTKVALKIMKSSYNDIGFYEINRLISLNSLDSKEDYPIVRLLDSFMFEGHVVMVLPLLYPGGIQRLKKIAFQLMKGLSFLERHCCIHADLKPENVLISGESSLIDLDGLSGPPNESNLSIVDFGNSFDLSESSLYYVDFELQSLLYRAPEVLIGVPFCTKIDTWSAACILVECVTGQPLFRGESRIQLFTSMITTLGELPTDIWANGMYMSDYVFALSSCSFKQYPKTYAEKIAKLSQTSGIYHEEFLDFIVKMLEYDPGRRLSPKKSFFHPFLRDFFPVHLMEFPESSQ